MIKEHPMPQAFCRDFVVPVPGNGLPDEWQLFSTSCQAASGAAGAAER